MRRGKESWGLLRRRKGEELRISLILGPGRHFELDLIWYKWRSSRLIYLSSPDRPVLLEGTCITVHYAGIVRGTVTIAGGADALSCVDADRRR